MDASDMTNRADILAPDATTPMHHILSWDNLFVLCVLKPIGRLANYYRTRQNVNDDTIACCTQH